MMGPPPPQRDGFWEPPPNEMRGEHYDPMVGRGGAMRGDRGHPPPFHRNRGVRGGDPGFRGRGGRGGERLPPPVRGRDGPHSMGHAGEHRGYSGEHKGHGQGGGNYATFVILFQNLRTPVHTCILNVSLFFRYVLSSCVPAF